MKNEKLLNVLAASYALYIKTQCYHWNVTGRDFFELHKLFEEQYRDLSGAIDLIAERIRALGAKVPASFSKYATISKISEANENLSAEEMIKDLAVGNREVAELLKDAISEYKKDDVTVSILTDRLEIHDKNIWVLSSSA